MGLLLVLSAGSCAEEGLESVLVVEAEDETDDEDSGSDLVINITMYGEDRGLYASYNPLENGDTGRYDDEQYGQDQGILISWRWLSTDDDDVAFDLYRKAGGTQTKLNDEPISSATCLRDTTANVEQDNTYYLTYTGEVVVLDSYVFTTEMAQTFYRTITLNSSDLPDAGGATYYVSDAGVGDIDGDGSYEIVVKRQTASIDNASSGMATGSAVLEAYEMGGSFKWRVTLGPNIRQGTHYIPFLVYDFDGDGCAELAVRTSEGTIFGDGTEIGDTDGDGITYYVDTDTSSRTYGKILSGPEFLSVIDGATGRELARTDYIARGDEDDWESYWGDTYGNRIDRFLMAVAHIDGEDNAPAIIMCRGYYKNWQMKAVSFGGGSHLTERWTFDTSNSGCSAYIGQGNHNLAVGDVDGDGYDEIVYGACCIDHNGTGLYSTGLGHGDAMHLGKFDPSRSGLQVVACHEDPDEYGTCGTEMRDAATGAIIVSIDGEGNDVGRCMVADVDPNTPGCEIWASVPKGTLFSCKGVALSLPAPIYKPGTSNNTYNMGIWWGGGLNRQTLDDANVNAYLTEDPYVERLFTGGNHDSVAAQGTKYNPTIYADLWGDWREEMIYPSADWTELHIFTTNIETTYRFHPLMDDHVYKMSVAHQNVGYNQPTHTGYYIGSDLED